MLVLQIPTSSSSSSFFSLPAAQSSCFSMTVLRSEGVKEPRMRNTANHYSGDYGLRCCVIGYVNVIYM